MSREHFPRVGRTAAIGRVATIGRAGALAIAGFVFMAAVGGASPVRAAEPVFGSPTFASSFGQGITLTQPVTLDSAPERVEVLLTYADAPGPLVVEVPPPTAPGRTTLTYRTSEADGHTLPNTPLEAAWRITPRIGDEPVVSPSVSGVYLDDRFDWKSVAGDVVRVHWYEGDEAFGRRALKIGEDAVASTSELLGVTESEPVDFYIYADQGSFYDALGPGTRENVGGQAVASIRTLFALIPPSGIDDPWVGQVVPHELVHLVFDTAASNPYHFPPRWLNEGLATYLSQGYDASDRRAVESAARDGRVIPLSGLTGQFPTSYEQFSLAYASSTSAVEFFIRTHGEDALVKLIRSYADGRTDDEAFTEAIGQTMTEFDAAWIAEIGADTPVARGPQPPPPGPQPAAWGGAAGPSGTPRPGEPTAGAGGTPSSPGSSSSGAGPLASFVLVAAVIVAIAVLVVVAIRTTRRRQAATIGGSVSGRVGSPGPMEPTVPGQPDQPAHPDDPAGRDG